MKKTLLACLTLWFALPLACSFAEGNMHPPDEAFTNGLPAPFMKSLNEVEPRTLIDDLPYAITNPGSYYVTANLTGRSGQAGIIISTNDVILDLRGFSLVGAAGGASTHGVLVQGGTFGNITVQNGVLRGWGGDGVSAINARDSHYLDLKAYSCEGDGLYVGSFSTVRNCMARGNTLRGIYAGQGSRILDCAVSSNTQSGIQTISGAVIEGCNANGNGIDGIQGTDSCRVTACTVRSNTGDGIQVNDFCIVKENIAELNQGHGIQINRRCRVKNNICAKNGISKGTSGIYIADLGNWIQFNSCGQNDYGITTEVGGSVIAQNMVNSNYVGQIQQLGANDLLGAILSGEGEITLGRAWANFQK